MESSGLKSLSRMFSEKLYRIPDYQRGYAWTDKQIKDFWNDITQLQDDRNHYVGVITLEEVKKVIYDQWPEDKWIIEGKNYQPYYVVDGQQRLTTSIIFIQAILEVAHSKGIEALNYSTLNEIKSKYIMESHGANISKSYLFGYEKDNPSYEFLKINIFNESSPSGYSKEETIYTNNLLNSKKYFVDKLNELDREQIEKVFRKLTQNFLFNTYSIMEDIDVFIAFESMNNRGIRLSNLELLKNRLIYLSTRFDINQNDQTELRRIINSAWRSIYHYLGRNSEKILKDDVFLRNHTDMFFGFRNSERSIRRLNGRTVREYLHESIADELSTRLLDGIFSTRPSGNANFEVNAENVKEYVENISNAVSVWFELNNPYLTNSFNDEEKIWLDKINRNEYCFREFSTLLLDFYIKKPTKIQSIKFLKLIEKAGFMMLLKTMYISRRSEEFKNLFDISVKRSSKDIIKILTDFVESNCSVFSDLRFRFELSGGFYDWPGIKYFLYEYELYLEAQTKQKKRKIDWQQYINEAEDFVTVEHIYPQHALDTYWNERFAQFNPSQARRLRDSLGNLLPLSKPKNSSLQNKSFDKKVCDGTRVGYKYGSYSEIEVSSLKEWTPFEILNRGVELLEFLEKRWGVVLGDRDKKVNILKLEFIEPKQQTKKLIGKIQG